MCKRVSGWLGVYAFMVCFPNFNHKTLNGYQQNCHYFINLLPYRIMNSELNSSVVHESFEFSDSDTTISSSSISLPVNKQKKGSTTKEAIISLYIQIYWASDA